MDNISEYQKETNNLNSKLLQAQYDMYRTTLQKMKDKPAKEKIQIGKFKFVKQIMEIVWAMNRTISKIKDLDSLSKLELLYVSSDDPNVDNLEDHFDEIVNDFYCDEEKEIKDAEEIQINLDEDELTEEISSPHSDNLYLDEDPPSLLEPEEDEWDDTELKDDDELNLISEEHTE